MAGRIGGGISRTAMVQATQAQLVLGKTEGMVDGWCWGWRGGVADYWGTKNEKGEDENLACGSG